MKKIRETIKLKKFRNLIHKRGLEANHINDGFFVLYENGRYKRNVSEYDLLNMLHNNNAKKILYVFDANDRMILDKGIEIYNDEDDYKKNT